MYFFCIEMYFPHTLSILLIVFYVEHAFGGDQCFNINQVQITIDSGGTEYIPCDSSASISSCCPKGWICLSNGLCEAHGDSSPNNGLTSLYTGYCTDPSWNNETVCPRICNNVATREYFWGSHDDFSTRSDEHD